MEKIAIVGSRKGVPREVVEQFLRMLKRDQPDAVVISGGASGVDRWAELWWHRQGGTVVSYRVKKNREHNGYDSYGVEVWTGNSEYTGLSDATTLTFADRRSALLFRNTMIVDKADRVVSFHHAHSPGTAFAKAYAKDRRVPVYEMWGKR
jgi:hypothetical protein